MLFFKTNFRRISGIRLNLIAGRQIMWAKFLIQIAMFSVSF